MAQRARLTWHGEEINARRRAGAGDGLTLAMEHLLTESRKEVPLEEGTLERSGVASVDTGSLTGAVSFDTVYAVRQHEELTWRHAAGRKAKYLEDPFNREARAMLEIVATTIRRALR